MCVLFAARKAIERGATLYPSDAQAQDLKKLLLSASSLLETNGSIKQKAYFGYLWARGGDLRAAERVFERTFQAALKADAQTREQLKTKTDKDIGRIPSSADEARNVLLLQARAGLLQSALRHADQADDYLLGWWIGMARTQFDLRALSQIVENWPAPRRAQHWFSLSIANSARGDLKQGRIWFERGRRIAQQNAALTRTNQQNVMLSFFAAHFLQDAALKSQTAQELRDLAEQQPASARFIKPEEIAAMPAMLDLSVKVQMGDSVASISAARLEQIAAQLGAAPPSDVQFRALEIVAAHYFLRKQPEKLLPVARTLLQTARALAQQAAAKRDKTSSLFNPYWPQPPRVLTAIFWLQRAGDQKSAATFAREFARAVPPKERPYAAMTLLQLGFSALADSVFDPQREIPLLLARQRENWENREVDWDAFWQWGEFAASEARFRAPDAPFRWFDQIQGAQSRAPVLRSWIGALYPEPNQDKPFVFVSPTSTSSSF